MIPLGPYAWVIKGGIIAVLLGGIWYHGYAFNGNRLTKKFDAEKNAAILKVQKEKDEVVQANGVMAKQLSAALSQDAAEFGTRVSAESERLRKYYTSKFVLPAQRSGSATGIDFATDAATCRGAAQAAFAEIARLTDEVVVAENAAISCGQGVREASKTLDAVERRAVQ